MRGLYEPPVANAVPLSQSAPLKLCARSIQRLVASVFPPLIAAEKTRLVNNRIDMLSVIRPVSRNVQCTVSLEATMRELQKRGLDHATLVMALLGPRVRKVQVDPP